MGAFLGYDVVVIDLVLAHFRVFGHVYASFTSSAFERNCRASISCLLPVDSTLYHRKLIALDLYIIINKSLILMAVDIMQSYMASCAAQICMR